MIVSGVPSVAAAPGSAAVSSSSSWLRKSMDGSAIVEKSRSAVFRPLAYTAPTNTPPLRNIFFRNVGVEPSAAKLLQKLGVHGKFADLLMRALPKLRNRLDEVLRLLLVQTFNDNIHRSENWLAYTAFGSSFWLPPLCAN